MHGVDVATIVTTIVTGLVTIATLVVGVVTLWLKQKHTQAKLDENTATTNLLDSKADTIVDQTNGSMDALRALVGRIADRVEKLEGYNRDSAHRVLDAVNAVHLKLTELAARQVPPVT